MLKQQLQQSLQQKLSPLQIQQIKMLELSSLEMEDRIRHELEENPALEQVDKWEVAEGNSSADEESTDELTTTTTADEDLSLGDYLSEDDIPDYKLYNRNTANTSNYEQFPYAESGSFRDFLVDQLRLRPLDARLFTAGEYIIGNLDDDGYLRREFWSVSDDLLFQNGLDVKVEELEEVLHLIQDFDPPGVGARSLQECLLLQMQRKKSTPLWVEIVAILTDYFEDFTRKHYEKIQKGLELGEDDLRQAIKEITQLNPKPGSAWESDFSTKLAQITPDFVVDVENGELILHMSNQNIPILRVSREFTTLLEEYARNPKNQSNQNKDAALFVKQKLDSAKWFVEAVKQRQDTLRKVMLSILHLQEAFFLTGDETQLKPMILKDVAELCGYDISTISRVSNSKYVQTNWGIYSLKFFFSEGMQNIDGEEVSTREIKIILQESVDEEDKTTPLTDDKLRDVLKEKGYKVARRTVAKYREQLGIPVARLRKEL